MWVPKPDDASDSSTVPSYQTRRYIYIYIIRLCYSNPFRAVYTHVLNSLMSERGQNIQNKHLKTAIRDGWRELKPDSFQRTRRDILSISIVKINVIALVSAVTSAVVREVRHSCC